MNSTTQSVLNDFQSEYATLYGDNFLFEINEVTNPPQLVLLTEKLASKLRELLKSPSDLEVVSLEKYGGFGNYYCVSAPMIDLYHHYRSPEEWERMMKGLDASMVTMQKTDLESHALVSELMNGEVFYGLETSQKPGWLAVSVCHDFEDIAPKQIGWIKLNEAITRLPERKLSRPQKLRTIAETIDDYSNLPYHLSGKSKNRGFDCSGLTQRVVYETKGIWIPRLAKWQALVCAKAIPETIKIDDLIFFEETVSKKIEHVGIITNAEKGEIKMFHSSRYSGGTKVEMVNDIPILSKGFTISSYGELIL